MDIFVIAAAGIGAGLTAVIAAVAAFVTMRARRARRARGDHGSDNTAYQQDGPIPVTQFSRFVLGDSPGRARIGYVTGRIIHVKGVDVWVNGENTTMEMARPSDFSVSAVIRAYSRQKDAAGTLSDIVYDELRAAVQPLASVVPGSVFVTSSGQLKYSNGVSHIIHVAAVQGEPGEGFRQIENIGLCVTNALVAMEELVRTGKIATGEDHPSIVFPLLGTGAGRGEVVPTVRRLVDAAVAYVDSTEDSAIRDIFFLAYATRDRDALVGYFEADPRFIVAAG